MLEIYAYVRHGFVTKRKNKVFSGLFGSWHMCLTRLHGDGLQRVALEWLYLAMLYRTQHPVQRNGGYAMLSCKLQLLDAGIIRSANENGRCRFKIFVVSTTCNMLASTL